jgi:hypothetical protein
MTIRLSEQATVASIGWAVAVAVIAAVGLVFIVKYPLRRDTAALGLCVTALAGLLVSPVSWTHHWVWVIPVAVVAAFSPHSTRALKLTVALLLCLMVTIEIIEVFGVPNQTYPDLDLARLLGANAYVILGLIIATQMSLIIRRCSLRERSAESSFPPHASTSVDLQPGQ